MSYDEMTELLEYRDRVASEIEAVEQLDREIEKQDRPEYVPPSVRRRYRRAPGVTCLHTSHTPGCGACRYAECWHNHARPIA